MLGEGVAPFFTPIYENTEIRRSYGDGGYYEERRLLGRNIRGQQAKLFIGKLEEVWCYEMGPIFTVLRLRFSLPGTIHADVYLKFYEQIPRIDFRLELGKTISSDIESVFLPLSLRFEDSSFYIRKGTEAFRPGIDQIPGTCMEYYMSDDGIAYVAPEGGAVIATRDTPLIYMGEMKHHAILLCDGTEENNHRPVYSWIMNNTWETNFKMDLSGFGEYKYSLWLNEKQNPEEVMNELKERKFDPYVMIIE